MKTALAMTVMVLGASGSNSCLSAATAEAVSTQIRAEATRTNHDPGGRPLPLASHWTTGSHKLSAGWAPERQLELIEQGHFLLPWFAHPPMARELSDEACKGFLSYYEKPIRRARELRLPIVFVATQWEHLLSRDPYLSLSSESNPNVVGHDGKIQPMVSPFGPVAPWMEVGRQWTSNSQMLKIQEWYPDPPLVIFLSNNEHSKLTWPKLGQDSRCPEDALREDTARRKMAAEGWIARYRSLQRGMREGLASATWKQAARFVGYEAFGVPHFARWGGWMEYSLYTPGRIDPGPLMWDGGSPSYYTHNWNPSTDFTGWSPQVEFQNLVFMEQEAWRLNPDFWIEMSVWDGFTGGTHLAPEKNDKRKHYESLGQSFSPERYAGFVQFGMWLLRPRAVREFRSWIHPWEDGKPYFMALVDSVDRVHRNATLRDWWRKGKLVPNHAREHFYQAAIPGEYRDTDRWFLLDADVNPTDYPWQLSTPVAVFSLALVQGKAPARQWIVYAHSPLAQRRSVKLMIPDYQKITVDVTIGGSFYEVDEKDGTTRRVE